MAPRFFFTSPSSALSPGVSGQLASLYFPPFFSFHTRIGMNLLFFCYPRTSNTSPRHTDSDEVGPSLPPPPSNRAGPWHFVFQVFSPPKTLVGPGVFFFSLSESRLPFRHPVYYLGFLLQPSPLFNPQMDDTPRNYPPSLSPPLYGGCYLVKRSPIPLYLLLPSPFPSVCTLTPLSGAFALSVLPLVFFKKKIASSRPLLPPFPSLNSF